LSDNPFDAVLWEPVADFDDLTDITYHRFVADGVGHPTVRTRS
jgi:naphthoate synthase